MVLPVFQLGFYGQQKGMLACTDRIFKGTGPFPLFFARFFHLALLMETMRL